MCPDLSLPQPSNRQGPKQRSLVISACVLFASFRSMSSGLAYCWVHSHTGFESVTSTNSEKAALKASAEMQPSADIFQYPGPLAEQPIAATNSSQYNSSADVGLRTARRNSNKMFQLIVRYVFIVRFKQQYQSKMQQDLVDFSSSKTISNAKLANNDFQLIVDLTLIPNREGLCAVLITSYSPSEGAHTACRFIVELDAAAKDV